MFGFNSGVMLFERSDAARTVLAGAWNATEYAHSVWEQSALRSAIRRNELLPQVTIYENLVAYPPQFWVSGVVKRNRTLRHATPLYHPAGCFLLAAKSEATCLSWLNKTLTQRVEGVGAAGGCTYGDDDLLRPRPMTRKDYQIPKSQRGGPKPGKGKGRGKGKS